jgi:uridine phosphorylase
VTESQTIHIHPTAPLAERVLLPGDPGRALLLAQTLLESPAMFNHNRGLWGYTGVAADGVPLTIQSTGMGGPSAAIVIAELTDLGARRFLRVGTCAALSRALALGDLLAVTEAIPADGTSRSLGANGPLAPDRGLLGALMAAGGPAQARPAGQASPAAEAAPTQVGAAAGPAGHASSAHTGRAHAGPVVSTDLFYDTPSAQEREWSAAGAVAVDMETATLFALARRRHIQAACLLLVTDLLLPARTRITTDALRAGEQRLGAVAVRALADVPVSS